MSVSEKLKEKIHKKIETWKAKMLNGYSLRGHSDTHVALGRLQSTIDSIARPDATFKIREKMQGAAYLVIMAELLFILALKLAANGIGVPESSQGYILTIGAGVTAILVGGVLVSLSVLKCAEALLSAMSANADRLDADFLFANSLILSPSRETEARYRDYNVRVFRAMSPGSMLVYASALGLAALVLLIESSVRVDTSTNQFLADGLLMPRIGGFDLVVLLCILPSVYVSISGIFLYIVSDYGARKWSRLSSDDLRRIAERMRAEKIASLRGDLRYPDLTYEDALELLGAPQGDRLRTDAILEASRGIDAEITRFNRVRRYYLLAIVVIVVIDAIIQLL
ncbi:MAG: hypothetical protein DRO73_00860 [Candidatus Thorarchaeota archaeon]|nr:MAG: hypothetical protein DRO73_00860 [Candidatus Thorarchaeota archaeon]